MSNRKTAKAVKMYGEELAMIDMNKKRATIISVLIVVLLLGTLLLLKHVDNSASAILDAKITADDDSRTSFATIYDNGKVEKSRSSQNKQFVKPIEVDPQVFVEHTDKKNNIYLTVNEKALRKNKQVSSDENWVKLTKLIAKRSKHAIAMLSLFKLGDDYYVFLKYNAGLSDEGSLYQYKSSLTKVATLDSGKISGLKKK